MESLIKRFAPSATLGGDQCSANYGSLAQRALRLSDTGNGQLAGTRAAANAYLGSDMIPLAVSTGTTTIAAVTAANVTVTVQENFKGDYLLVDQDIAQFFIINSIKVGRDEQLVSSDPIPASAFSSYNQRMVGLDMKECPPSLNIVFNVTNVDVGAAHTFRATLFGSCGGCNATSRPAGPKPPVVLGVGTSTTTPFGTSVAAAASATITVTPQVPFKGEQLVVCRVFGPANDKVTTVTLQDEQDFVSAWTVNSIKVGRDEQLVSSDPVPAAAFSNLANPAAALDMETCDTAHNITIQVTNRSIQSSNATYAGGGAGITLEFAGALFGSCGDCNA